MTSFLEKCTFVVNTADEPYLGYTANLTSQLCVPRKINHYIAGGFDAHLASTGELIIPYVTPCAACYATYFDEQLKDWKPAKHPVVERANEIGGLGRFLWHSSKIMFDKDENNRGKMKNGFFGSSAHCIIHKE